jgi:dynein heavy chain
MFNYIIEQLGENFISPPPFDLNLIYKDSSSITPLIFVLSPGADPLNSLVKYGELKKKHIDTVSLGQGQGPKAERFIQEAVQKGSWVVL